MKSRWKEEVEGYLGRATRGLVPDPELRMKVSHELRTRLEETVLYARATGATAEEAEAHALNAFGAPDELSDELRAGNLRRMRQLDSRLNTFFDVVGGSHDGHSKGWLVSDVSSIYCTTVSVLHYRM